MKQKIPLNNVKEVSWENGKVSIVYKDGTRLMAPAEDIILVSDYQNENDYPLIDHCI